MGDGMGATRRWWWGALTAALLAVGGCARTQVETDYDRRTNFAAFRTFDIRGAQVLREGMPDPGDTLIRDRVASALAAELAEKGLRRDQVNPDLIVTFTTGSRTRRELSYSPSWGAGLGWGWGRYWDYGPAWGFGYGWGYPYYADTWVEEYQEGWIAVDVVDARSGRLVYRTSAESVDRNFRDPSFIRKAVDKAFKKYPGPA